MAVIRDPLAGVPRPVARGDAADAYALLDPDRTFVLTGAGMSTDSGIPDYRGPGSIGRRPMSVQTFLAGPRQQRRYWARSFIGYARFRRALPNRGHRDLAAIGPAHLVTQNVDGLHEDAGSDPVIDLHGRIDRVLCLNCRRGVSRAWLQQEFEFRNAGFLEGLSVSPGELETAPDGDVELEETDAFELRECPHCGGVLKPDVVFFGENVPEARVRAADAALAASGAVLVLGSSLAVLSGLRFARRAARDGRPLVIVTDGPTRADDLAAVRIVGRVGDFLAGWKSSLAN